MVVLSLWRGGVCTGTFRLPVDEVPDLIDVLRAGWPPPRARTTRTGRAGDAADLAG